MTRLAESPRASNARTRTRLLNKLGLFQETSSSRELVRIGPSDKKSPVLRYKNSEWAEQDDGLESFLSPRRQGSSLLGDAEPFEMELKPPAISKVPSSPSLAFFQFFSSLSPSSTTALPPPETPPSSEKDSKPSIRFQESVQVVSIPSKDQYSNRIRQLLWCNADELHEMAEKNTIEFAFEGYNWRNVVEEEDMYVEATNGRLIHPCYVDDCYYDDKPCGGLSRSTTLACLQDAEDETSNACATNAIDEEEEDDFVFGMLQRRSSSLVSAQ